MNDAKNWTTHVEFMVLLVTLLGGFYILDGKIERATGALSERTDRLYELYCEARKDADQKFYDLLKAQK